MELPAWVASIEQGPCAIIVTVFPETVHTVVVVDVKLTAKPELAVALTVNGAAPNVCPGSAAKVMVCVSLSTPKLRVTSVAAAKLELPACVASIEQAPCATKVTVFPDTVQTGVVSDAKLTAKPELAVALTVNGAAPYVLVGRDAKVMV